MQKITLSKVQLQNLLAVLEVQQQKDNSISNHIEIELQSKTEYHNSCDKVKFYAQSVLLGSSNHFLGSN